MNPASPPLPRCRPAIAWPLVWPALALILLTGAAAAATHESPRHLTADAVYDPQALRALAERGDKRAAFLLGSRFSSGRSGVRDDSEAVRWFRQAAEGGLAEAQYNLGVMYAGGRGVPRDDARAAQWYRKAAEQGLAEAQFNLGTLLGLGRGVERDEAEAARWLEKAAEQGLAQAQYNIGALYEHGRGVRLDGRRALEWYARAAGQGFEPAVIRHAALAQKLAPPAADPPAATPAPATPVAVTVPPGMEKPPPPAAAGAAAAARTGAAGTWVASLDPALYTLQLGSFTTREDALRLMREFPDGAEVGVYGSKKLGRQWYSVVHGVYTTFGAAEAGIADLPERIRAMKPWVRKVALIQQQMD